MSSQHSSYSSHQAVQQYNPNTGHLDSQVYYPIEIDGVIYYRIEPYGWVPADPGYNQHDWSHNHYANQSPLLPDTERPPFTIGTPSRIYSVRQMLDLYEKSTSTHFKWKDKEQKQGNPIPNGAWGRFQLEADKIIRNCTIPKTKKAPRVRPRRELIAHMRESYKLDGKSQRPMINEKLPTHHGVVYDKWKSNKDRRDAAERENSILNQELLVNEEGENRAKVVIYQDGDESISFDSGNVQVCEGGEGKENNNDNDRASDISQKNSVKKSQKAQSPRKPFGVKN